MSTFCENVSADPDYDIKKNEERERIKITTGLLWKKQKRGRLKSTILWHKRK